jgi:hypothetical protein
MAKVLARLSIPPRLRDGMMLKEGHPNTFDVPNTKKGVLFLEFWKTAKSEVRDALMKRAYEEEVPIVDVKPEDADEEAESSEAEEDEEEDEEEND